LPAGGPVTAVREVTVAVKVTGLAGTDVPGGTALNAVVVFDLLTTWSGLSVPVALLNFALPFAEPSPT